MNSCTALISEIKDYNSFKKNHERTETICRRSGTKVTLFQNKSTGECYAIKRLTLGDRADQEFKIGQLFCHENLMKTYQKFDRPDKSKTYIVMEYAEGTLVKDMEKYSFLESKAILRQLFAAMDHCLNKEIIPLDLNLGNVIVSSENNIKMIDFGMYRACDKADPFHFKTMHGQILIIISSVFKKTILDVEQREFFLDWSKTLGKAAPEINDVLVLRDWYIEFFQEHLEHPFLS